MGMGNMGKGKSSSSSSTGGKGSSSCDYAEAFGDAITAGFEVASGLPTGTESLDNVLESVVVSGAGSCPSTAQIATVVLTYKPESTPVDPVAYADAARAWQTGGGFPITINVCGCSTTIDLTDTTSGYAAFTGKGTPKSGKCKGGYSPESSPKTGKKLTSAASTVGAQSATAAVATVAAVAVLVVIVAMALIKRKTGLANQKAANAEVGVATHNPMFATDEMVVKNNPLFISDAVSSSEVESI
jgi:hypothetical protein